MIVITQYNRMVGTVVTIPTKNPTLQRATSVFVYLAKPEHTPHIFLSDSLL